MAEGVREQNKRRVTEQALELFVHRGIFNTKITEIAEASELTERSVYRYFETKADLVLEAALLFWRSGVAAADEIYLSGLASRHSGAEQIEAILLSYAELYFAARKKLIFIHEAEIFLHHEGLHGQAQGRPPAPYKSFSAPLARAIACGIADGSVRADLDLESLYYSTYDSLLGLMQKMAISNEFAPIDEGLARTRLTDFCKLLTSAFLV